MNVASMSATKRCGFGGTGSARCSPPRRHIARHLLQMVEGLYGSWQTADYVLTFKLDHTGGVNQHEFSTN